MAILQIRHLDLTSEQSCCSCFMAIDVYASYSSLRTFLPKRITHPLCALYKSVILFIYIIIIPWKLSLVVPCVEKIISLNYI